MTRKKLSVPFDLIAQPNGDWGRELEIRFPSSQFVFVSMSVFWYSRQWLVFNEAKDSAATDWIYDSRTVADLASIPRARIFYPYFYFSILGIGIFIRPKINLTKFAAIGRRYMSRAARVVLLHRFSLLLIRAVSPDKIVESGFGVSIFEIEIVQSRAYTQSTRLVITANDLTGDKAIRCGGLESRCVHDTGCMRRATWVHRQRRYNHWGRRWSSRAHAPDGSWVA